MKGKLLQTELLSNLGQIAQLLAAGGAGGAALAWLNHGLSKRRLVLEIWFSERQSQLIEFSQMLMLPGEVSEHYEQFRRVALSASMFCGSDCRRLIIGHLNMIETRAAILTDNGARKPFDQYGISEIEAAIVDATNDLAEEIRLELLRQPSKARARIARKLPQIES